MNIARLGVEIDPTGARQGARQSVEAINSMATAAESTERRIKDATARAGKAMGDNMKTGAEGAAAASGKLADADKKLHEGMQRNAKRTSSDFGSMVSGVTSFLTNLGGLIPGNIGLFSNLAGMAFQAATGLAAMAASGAGVASSSTAAAAGLSAEATAAAAAGTASEGAAAGMGSIMLVIAPLVAILVVLAAALLAAGAAAVTAYKAIGAAASMESTIVQFKVLIGNAELTKKTLEELRTFADVSPFGTNDVMQFGQQMLNAGIAAKDLTSTMNVLGNVSLGNLEKMKTATLVYTQTMMSNKVQGNDLLQFSNAGIPIIEGLANAMHKSKGEIRGLVEDGKVGFKELKAAVESLGGEGGRLAGMMDKMAQTWEGKMSTVSASWDNVLVALGTPIKDALKPLLDRADAFLKSLVPTATAVGNSIAHAISLMTGLFDQGKFGVVISDSLTIAFETSVNVLMKGVLTVLGMVAPLLMTGAEAFIDSLLLLAKPSFWKGAGAALLGIAVDFGTRLLTVMLKPIAAFQAGIEGAIDAMMRKLPSWLGGYDTTPPVFDFTTAMAGYEASLKADIIEPNKIAAKDLYGTTKTEMTAALGDIAAHLQTNLAATAEAAKGIYNSLQGFFPEDQIEKMKKALEETLLKAQEVGDALKKDIEIPDRPADPNAGALGDNSKKNFKTDAEIMKELKEQLGHLQKEKADMTSLELTRRRDELTGTAIGSLADPRGTRDKYPQELDKWRAYNADKEKIAKETDLRIEAGGASMFEAMGRGMQKTLDGWGNMAQQMSAATGAITNSISTHLSGALGDLITGTKDAATAFREMAVGILKDIANIITKMLVELAIQYLINAAKTAMGGFSGGGTVGAAGSLDSQALASDGGDFSIASSSSAAATTPSYTPTVPSSTNVNVPTTLPSGGGGVSGDGGLFPDRPDIGETAGGNPFGFAGGGQVKRGGRGGIDDIPAYLTRGEFVVPKDAVEYYGTPFLEALRNRRVHKLAEGGIVGHMNSARSKAGNGAGAGVSVQINVDMGKGSSSSKVDGQGDDRKKGEALARNFEAMTMQIITREKRPGGILA